MHRHCKCRLSSSRNLCASSILFSPFFALLTSAAKLMIEGAFAVASGVCPFGDASPPRPLDGLGLPLLPPHGDGARPGSLGDIGPSKDLRPDDGGGSPGSGSLRRRLFVSCQNLAGTLMPRRRGGSPAPELLPDETLSVSDEAERSGAAAAAGSDGERVVVESKAMERRRRWTAARMESLRSRLQSRLRASGSDALGFAAGHRFCGRAFSASGTEDTLFRRSGVGPRRAAGDDGDEARGVRDVL
jgi:hypothetical protein